MDMYVHGQQVAGMMGDLADARDTLAKIKRVAAQTRIDAGWPEMVPEDLELLFDTIEES